MNFWELIFGNANEIGRNYEHDEDYIANPDEFAKFLVDNYYKINTPENLDKIIDYTYMRLSQDYRLSKWLPTINFDKDLPPLNAFYDNSNNTISLSDKAFCFKNSNTPLIAIGNLFHEMRHFAQYRGQRLDGQKSLQNSYTKSTENINELTKALAIQSINDNCDIYSHRLNEDKLFCARTKYFNYFEKEYWQSEMEMDARAYAISELSEILESMHKLTLSPLDNYKAYKMEQSVDYLFDQEEYFFLQRSSDLNKEKVSQENLSYRKKILKNNPMIWEFISNNNLSELEKLKSEYIVDIPTVLTESLIYDYESTLATQLFKSLTHGLIKSGLELKDYVYGQLFVLILEKTPYVPTIDEYEAISKYLNLPEEPQK